MWYYCVFICYFRYICKCITLRCRAVCVAWDKSGAQMGKESYIRPAAEVLEVLCEEGIALSYGTAGAAGADLQVDETDLDW